MIKKIAFTLAVAVFALPCHAQLFQATQQSTFSTAPWSQMGPVTNNLVLTDTPTGFIVSGQAIVNLGPASPIAPISGILIEWEVERLLNPSFGSANLQTSTILTGFSQPPLGIVLNSAGYTYSEFDNYPGSSLSNMIVTLVGGVDLPPWNNLTVTSSTFSYTSGGAQYLRQHFVLDGIYFSGPGGNWIIDVPLESTVEIVPEPSSMVLSGLGLVGLTLRLRRRKL